MHRRFPVPLSVVVAVLALALAIPTFAQSALGTLRGIVRDQQGGALPGVTVTIRQVVDLLGGDDRGERALRLHRHAASHHVHGLAHAPELQREIHREVLADAEIERLLVGHETGQLNGHLVVARPKVRQEELPLSLIHI